MAGDIASIYPATMAAPVRPEKEVLCGQPGLVSDKRPFKRPIVSRHPKGTNPRLRAAGCPAPRTHL
jgi:hypothetical protein